MKYGWMLEGRNTDLQSLQCSGSVLDWLTVGCVFKFQPTRTFYFIHL